MASLPTSKLSGLTAYRWAVFSRCIAAIFGGYALSAAAASVIAVSLPGPRAEAVMAATLWAFVIYCGAVVWVFATRNAWRAWIGVGVPATALAVCAWRLAPGVFA